MEGSKSGHWLYGVGQHCIGQVFCSTIWHIDGSVKIFCTYPSIVVKALTLELLEGL